MASIGLNLTLCWSAPMPSGVPASWAIQTGSRPQPFLIVRRIGPSACEKVVLGAAVVMTPEIGASGALGGSETAADEAATLMFLMIAGPTAAPAHAWLPHGSESNQAMVAASSPEYEMRMLMPADRASESCTK